MCKETFDEDIWNLFLSCAHYKTMSFLYSCLCWCTFRILYYNVCIRRFFMSRNSFCSLTRHMQQFKRIAYFLSDSERHICRAHLEDSPRSWKNPQCCASQARPVALVSIYNDFPCAHSSRASFVRSIVVCTFLCIHPQLVCKDGPLQDGPCMKREWWRPSEATKEGPLSSESSKQKRPFSNSSEFQYMIVFFFST